MSTAGVGERATLLPKRAAARYHPLFVVACTAAVLGLCGSVWMQSTASRAVLLGGDHVVFQHSWDADDFDGRAETRMTFAHSPQMEVTTKFAPTMANAKGIISSDYGILLKGPWTASQATSVLKTLREIHKVGLHWRPPATLELVGKLLPADIVPKSFVDGKPTSDALISDDVFRHSEPREAVLDQVKGKLTSSRLRQALITFLTRFGYDSELAQFILQHHFGTVYGVGHGNKPNFTTLTDPTTREGPGRFDDFLPMEMVWILHWFWEMPNYMHRIDALDWLVRRAYGQEHPYYPYSPAVSWPDSERHSYTEYGDITFSRDCETMRHLILHEKCHFLYARQLSDSQIEGWKELSGWATRPGGDWQPAVSTPFVSGYAARVNPDEDMAETMAEYILHPALLFSRSPAKFQYFERAIMEGHRYMPRAWPSAQFLVVNQAPYANYPAKVTNVRISVTGALNDDKYVEVVLRLAPVPGFSTPLHAELDVAPESGGDSSARLTFHSLPHDPTTLVANTTIDRRLPYGFWTASQLKLNDDVGLCRYIPLDRSSWRLYVNNRRISNGENIVYVPDTLHVTVTEHVPGDEPNQDFTQVSVKWRYTSSSPPYPRWPANARIYRVGAKSSYFKSKWGHCKDLMRGDGVGECEVLFSLNDYDEGEWRVSLVYMQDATGASYMEYFDRWVWDERATSFKVAGKGTDVLAPQVDADSVAVECIAKDSQGASDVHISFTARDDLSGIGYISYRLLDPQGVSHLGELVHEDSKTHRFKGNPAAWKKFDFHLPLPKGSFPGVWAIEEIEVWDKVGNRVDLRMVETLHFVPDDPGAYGDGDDGFDGTTYSPEPTEAPTPAPTPSPTPSPTPQSPTLGPHAKAKTDKTKAGQPQTKKSKSESK